MSKDKTIKENKSKFPRQHLVSGGLDRRSQPHKVRTDYDQRLWPVRKIEKHGTG